MSKPITVGGDGNQTLLERPVRETDLDELVQLFLSAAKPQTQWFLGLEIELFGFFRDGLGAADHETLARVLARLGDARGMEREHELSGALVGLKGGGQVVSLEPGGQLELASTPHRSLKKLRRELLDWGEDLKAAAAPEGVGFWAMGQQPFVTKDDAPHMPKARYDRMRAYLGQSGTRGLDMMHLTGSVQCAVDFQSEANLVNKVRTAVRASPFLSALVAASPFTAGKPNGMKSRRYWIWLDTDESRCGIWPEMLDAEGLTYRRYLERALRTRPMFMIRDGRYLPTDDRPFGHFAEHGFEGTTVTVSDLLDHLTSFFPEVRPKTYLEIRGADCLPPAGAVAIAGFWRGILDDEDTRLAVEERLSAMDYEALRRLQPQVAELGLEAESAAGPVGEIAEWLMKTAYERLRRGAPDCAECLVPLVERAEARRSPADDMLEIAARDGVAAALASAEI